MACSQLTMDRDPLPDSSEWAAIAEPRERLSAGLSAIYAWYERNADLARCVLRDGEHHELTREVSELRWGPALASYQDVLGTRLSHPQAAMLRLALSFFTWRTLVREAGLGQADAVAAMVDAVLGTGGGPPRPDGKANA